MYDFIILSLPRSGSHMLASALDSHPEISCEGEYEMIDKIPIGHTRKQIHGCIVQAYHIRREIAPISIPTKIIRIKRPLVQIVASRFLNSIDGTNSDQHTEPVKKEGISHTLKFKVWNDLLHDSLALDEFTASNPALTVSYNDMCKGKDARKIEHETALRICDYLEVTRAPLIPATYKPS